MPYRIHEYKAVESALTLKGFKEVSENTWEFWRDGKFIRLYIDFAGFIRVNFWDKTVKLMAPSEVIEGLNYLKGSNELQHRILFF